MKRRVVMIDYFQRAPAWWKGAIMIVMKKGSELRMDLKFYF